ncbi:MAG: TPM domain-containing protein, partial [Myxococcales bacterium]|nr:TPM domain-containing protein [Myxococcales bacterium]
MKLQFVFLLLFSILTGCDRERDLDPALLGGNHLRDPAAVLAPADRRMLEKQLALFERETGVDLRVITVELGAGASLEEFTRENLKLHAPVASPRPRGGSADGGTALLIYDARQGHLRVEIGYALEQIFPDAFVGFLIREHARYLFDEGRPAEALLFTVRILRDQIRSAVLRGDLRGPSQNTLAGYAHGGAGASDRAPLGGKTLDPFASSSRSKPLAGSIALGSPLYGRAGSSVESAYQHYLAWLAAGRFETDLALFTAETRSFLAEWPMTPG